MFEQRKRGWNYTWAGILGVVIIIIAVIQIFRVNPPERPASTAEPKIIWTEGQILQGVAEISAGEFLSFPLNLNRRATLKAYYTTGENEKRIAATIIRADDFNMWKLGEKTSPLVATGYVPRGVITRVMEPGNYLFLLDNREGSESIKIHDVDVKIE